MNVVLFPQALGFDGLSPEHRAFCLARQAMNERLLAWLYALPDRTAIAEEVGSTQNVMEQMIKLELGE